VPSDSADVYLVEEDFGRHGVAFVETDKAEADREAILGRFLSGQYRRPLRVIAFTTAFEKKPPAPSVTRPQAIVDRHPA
jgi:hypothetical protein